MKSKTTCGWPVRRCEMKRLLQVLLLSAVSTALFADILPPGTPNGLYAIFTTGKGVIVAKLYEKYTPIAVANFVGLATGRKQWLDPVTHQAVARPMYDNLTFHRVIRGEMIQSGDPTGTSAHNCGFTIPDEFLVGLNFNSPGKLAVANAGQPNTGACQFFITAGTVERWNNQYTIFGDVISGMDVVTEINKMPLKGDKPLDPVKLISVKVVRLGPPPAAKKQKEKKQ
jgi:peptidyl-prolyl cis-trans isomerase A (cyclophilin A)